MSFLNFQIKLNQFIIFTILLVCSSVINSVRAEPLTIRFSHVVSGDAVKAQLAKRFKELVEARLGSDIIQVKIYENSSLFNDNELADALVKGQVEMGIPAISKLKKYSNRLQIFDIPFLFVSPEAAANFTKGPYGERLLKLVNRKGLTGLGFLSSGMKQLSAKTPIKLPKDLVGLRYRIMNSDILEAQFRTVEAVPFRHPFNKVYSLLKDNEIDGQENTWANMHSKKFYEYQPYIIESNHGYLAHMVLTSTKFWQTIPTEDIRVSIKQSLNEALEFANNLASSRAELSRLSIVNANTSNIHTMTIEERKAWVEAMQPVWKAYEDEIGLGLIQAAASAR